MTPAENTAAIIARIASQHGVPVRLIYSKQQDRETSHARQHAFLALYETGMSLSAIGRALNRDHTTVIHGVRQARKRLAA